MLLLLLCVALGVGTSGIAPARADDDQVRRRDSCSGGPSEWELRVRRVDGSRLRIRFEIEEGTPDNEWQLFLSDNGRRVYAGTKVSDAEGGVRVRRSTADRTGDDLIKASGVDLENGEICSGSVTFH